MLALQRLADPALQCLPLDAAWDGSLLQVADFSLGLAQRCRDSSLWSATQFLTLPTTGERSSSPTRVRSRAAHVAQFPSYLLHSSSLRAARRAPMPILRRDDSTAGKIKGGVTFHIQIQFQWFAPRTVIPH
jgi:hypothetical protein